MESVPRVGMYFESVRSRLKKLDAVKGNPQLRKSLVNQARLHDGDGAAKELNKELDFNGSAFSCSGNKQSGWGTPDKKTDEEMLKDGWIKTGEGKWRKTFE